LKKPVFGNKETTGTAKNIKACYLGTNKKIIISGEF
jgi:hypothetical protein